MNTQTIVSLGVGALILGNGLHWSWPVYAMQTLAAVSLSLARAMTGPLSSAIDAAPQLMAAIQKDGAQGILPYVSLFGAAKLTATGWGLWGAGTALYHLVGVIKDVSFLRLPGMRGLLKLAFIGGALAATAGGLAVYAGYGPQLMAAVGAAIGHIFTLDNLNSGVQGLWSAAKTVWNHTTLGTLSTGMHVLMAAAGTAITYGSFAAARRMQNSAFWRFNQRLLRGPATALHALSGPQALLADLGLAAAVAACTALHLIAPLQLIGAVTALSPAALVPLAVGAAALALYARGLSTLREQFKQNADTLTAGHQALERGRALMQSDRAKHIGRAAREQLAAGTRILTHKMTTGSMTERAFIGGGILLAAYVLGYPLLTTGYTLVSTAANALTGAAATFAALSALRGVNTVRAAAAALLKRPVAAPTQPAAPTASAAGQTRSLDV